MTIVTQNYVDICADPECTQKGKIEVVRPIRQRAVSDFNEMTDEEKRKIKDVDQYATMLYTIDINQVMNKVRHLVSLRRQEKLNSIRS